MTSLLNEMRKAKDITQSLKTDILSTLSAHMGKKVFIFEGNEDFSMYEIWINNTLENENWMHVFGKGKKQLISLYSKLIDEGDHEILPYCYFFIDQDYDIDTFNDKHILTLDCYSAENYIICKKSISSILKDEFKLIGERINLYNKYIKIYENDFLKFNLLAKELCKPLFVIHNTSGKVRHYDKISQLINIEINDIGYHQNYNTKLIEFDTTSPYLAQFNNLPDRLAIKGKYVYEFAKLWLKKLKEQLKIEDPELTIKKDPQQIELRRFACTTATPKELEVFLTAL